MFFPGTTNIFVPGDSAFLLFKCMCNNIDREKKTGIQSRIENFESITVVCTSKKIGNC